MRIDFNDGGYIETIWSPTPGKIHVVIAAHNAANPLETTINSVELTVEQLNLLLAEFGVKPTSKIDDVKPKPKKKTTKKKTTKKKTEKINEHQDSTKESQSS